MLRLGTNLSNKFQRRTLRPLYAQSQAYPYAAQLDSGFDRTQGAYAGSNAITGAKGAIIPGLVAIKKAGETVTLSPVAASSNRAFGLFANFVGGEISDIPSDQTSVGVWKGVGSVFELLAPAFDTTSLSTDAAAEDGTAGNETYFQSNAKGQLKADTPGAYAVSKTARLVSYLSANAIVVELLV